MDMKNVSGDVHAPVKLFKDGCLVTDEEQRLAPPRSSEILLPSPSAIITPIECFGRLANPPLSN